MKTKLMLFLFFFITIFVQLNASNKSDLEEYTGRYVFPIGTPVDDAVITLLCDTTLSVSVSLGTIDLTPVDKDSFGIPQYGGTVTFVRNELNQITGFKVSIPMGEIEDLEATKELKIAEN